MEETVGLVCIIIFYIFLLLFFIRNIINSSSIKKNSELFIELKKLNYKYAPFFEVFQNKFKFNHICNSLQKYKNNCNRTSVINYMCDLVRKKEDNWKKLYSKTNKNRQVYYKYLEEYELLKRYHTGKSYNEIKKKSFLLSEKKYLKLEEKICKKNLLTPIINLLVKVTVSYTSPGGRNHYETEYTLTNKSIAEIFTRIENRRKYEKDTAYQRSLMTCSKRYNILRRDGFRCQICGKSQADGVKLEVDHIMPVSKGGKTVDENLQTLCHECNQGKKDKL